MNTTPAIEINDNKEVHPRCVCCGRRLSDPSSYELGIGPDCMNDYGYVKADCEPMWTAVDSSIKQYGLTGLAGCRDIDWIKKIVVARSAQVNKNLRGPHAALLNNLGFTTLAKKLASRIKVKSKGVVSITIVGENYGVYTPFNSDFINDLKAACSFRKFVNLGKFTKYWLVGASDKPALFKLLKHHFKGYTLKHPKGEIIL